MTTGLAFPDTLAPPKGHLVLRVFRGEVTRERLSDLQREENRAWMEEGRLPSGIVVPLSNANVIPVHVGRILDFPVDVVEADNLVTTTGKGLLLDRLFALGTPPGALTAMGVGNSATAAAVGDTQLGGATPSPDLRLFDALPTRASLVVTAIRTYATAEGNMNWQEIALFNGTTNGTSVMFNRIAPIGAFNKTSAVSIQATITITQS